MSTSGGKACFQALEGSAGSFYVQYNPKEFKVDKTVSWKEHDDQGQTNAGLEFQKGAPMKVSMELLFDTTNEGNGDVRTKWVNSLLALTNADVSASEGGTDKKRPTKVKFTWGSFDMTCVVESVNVSYIMFASDGTPIRARVSIAMKEWNPTDITKGSGGDYISGEKVKLVTASSATTASAVAQQNNTTTSALLAANPQISDPTDIPAGTVMAIPSKGGSSSVSSNRPSSLADDITSALKDAEKVVKEAEKAYSTAKSTVERLSGSSSGSKTGRSGGAAGAPGATGSRSGGGRSSSGGGRPSASTGAGSGPSGGGGAKPSGGGAAAASGGGGGARPSGGGGARPSGGGGKPSGGGRSPVSGGKRSGG